MNQDGSTTYNGWANYETWCAYLWLTNEQGGYRYWREEARRCRREAWRCDQVRDGLWTAEQAARFALAERLKDEVEREGECPCASLYTDLLQAALSRVEWAEVAGAFLDEVEPGPG